MKIQIKKFSVNTLEKALSHGIFKNTANSIDRDKYVKVLMRYNHNIPQDLLYAIEDPFSGEFTILSNDLVDILISEKEEIFCINRKRRMGLYELSVVILESTDLEEIELFKNLTNK